MFRLNVALLAAAGSVFAGRAAFIAAVAGLCRSFGVTLGSGASAAAEASYHVYFGTFSKVN